MNNIYQMPNQDQCYEEASQWLAKLDRGLSGEEEKELRKWLDASQHNRQLFQEMARFWDRMDALSRLSELFPRVVERSPAKRWVTLAMAASLLLASVVGMLSMFLSNSQSLLDGVASLVTVSNKAADVYETAVGEYSSVQLSDGTHLLINTNSLLKVKYTAQQRFIILERGEIHIDVAHDESRPLTVQAGNQIVQAVGTSFNVELRSDQNIELVVTEGKVLVGVHPVTNQKVEEWDPVVLPSSSKLISKGEQLITGLSVEEIERIEPTDIEIKLSWREGNLIFKGESLEAAVEEISRYTPVEFIFLDENLKKIRVAGLFKAGDVTGLLATLRQNFNITYERKGDKVLLGGQ